MEYALILYKIKEEKEIILCKSNSFPLLLELCRKLNKYSSNNEYYEVNICQR